MILALCPLALSWQRANAFSPDDSSVDDEGKRSIDDLITELGGSDEARAFAALRSLEKAGVDAVPRLAQALRSPSFVLRFRAARALSNAGEKALTVLIAATNEKDAVVRYLAVEAIKEMGPRASSTVTITALAHALAHALEDSSEEVRRKAAMAMAGLGDAAVSDLGKCLESKNLNARRLAAYALERIHSAKSASDPTEASPRSSDTTAWRGAWSGEAFSNVTAERGIRFEHVNGASGLRFMPETIGAGAAWLDYDGDGFLDLYLVQGHRHPEKAFDGPGGPREPSDVLYKNLGGKLLEDVTSKSGISERGYGMGAAVGDYDQDGRPDLYVTNYGRNTLYHNRADGTFEDVTELAGVGASGWSTSATWADFDGDHYLDLFVVRYVDYDTRTQGACETQVPGRLAKISTYCHPHHFDGVADVLYRNLGDGTFRDVSVESGIAASQGRLAGKGLGVLASDFDGDADVDILVANDSTPNALWRNLGGFRFEDVSFETGFAFNADGVPRAGMGIDQGDVDGDLRFDYIVANFGSEPDTLYLGQNGFFIDGSTSSGIAKATFLPLGFGLRLVDFDLDGDLDLYCANGHVLDNAAEVEPGGVPGFGQPDLLLENDGSGHFANISGAAGRWFEQALVGRGVAEADYDNDGDPDLLVTNCGGPVVLLENRAGDGRRWIGFEPRRRRDARGRLPPVNGATLEIEVGGWKSIHEIAADGSFLSAHDPRIRVGLGARTGLVTARVRWPGVKEAQVFSGLAPGSYHAILEK